MSCLSDPGHQLSGLAHTASYPETVAVSEARREVLSVSAGFNLSDTTLPRGSFSENAISRPCLDAGHRHRYFSQ
jgi:hypothetical protein